MLLLSYVEDLLDHRQISEGVFERKVVEFDPNQVLQLVVDLLYLEARKKQIELDHSVIEYQNGLYRTLDSKDKDE